MVPSRSRNIAGRFFAFRDVDIELLLRSLLHKGPKA
jgi:hypothetical protein